METITNASTNLRLTTHMDVFEDCDGVIIAPRQDTSKYQNTRIRKRGNRSNRTTTHTPELIDTLTSLQAAQTADRLAGGTGGTSAGVFFSWHQTISGPEPIR